MNEHSAELMEIEGVVAVYIGELDNGTSCIHVIVLAGHDDSSKLVPKKLKGHPVVVEIGDQSKT